MDRHKPRVSIGLPVYNGENYLEKAIKAILAQTYSDFELIISDNASTDRTQEICLDYAARDRRIRYYRNEKNTGGASNFNRVFELSSCEYFKWAAHDDIVAPDYLLKCVAVLDQDHTVILCHSKVKVIDSSGKVLNNSNSKIDKAGSIRPQDRFADLILDDRECVEVFGLIRRNTLKLTTLFGNYVASDRTILAELGLLGRFFIINKYLFFLRDHPERSIRAMPAHHLRVEWFDPANAGKIVFPHWRAYFEYFKCVRRISLTHYEQACCCFHLVCWLKVNMNWARLLSDLFIAFVPKSWKFFFKLANVQKLKER